MTALPYWRWLLGAGLAVVILLIGVGLSLDSRGFTSNLVAEAAGVIASALLAVFLVDRLVAADRKARWRVVERRTSDTLRSAVVRSALPIYLLLPAPRSGAADPFTMNEAGSLGPSLKLLEAAVRTHAQNPYATSPPVESLAETVADSVIPSARLITDVILPRLLLVGAGPSTVQPVVELERSVGKAEYDIWMSATFGLPIAALFDDLAEIVHQLGNLVAVLDAESDVGDVRPESSRDTSTRRAHSAASR